MASSSSFSTITNEDFNLFHSIDRQFYSRLILDLGRDPAESMHIVAFLLWLERAGRGHRLIKTLLSWPNLLVNHLAEEVKVCLNCVESDNFVFAEGPTDIALLQSLTESTISLQYLHENRIGVLRGVTKIVNEVCGRAFEDILRRSFGRVASEGVTVPLYHFPTLGVVSHVGFGGNVNVAPFLADDYGAAAAIKGGSTQVVAIGGVEGYDPNDFGNQRQVLNNELGEMFRSMKLDLGEEEKEVPPDDRTIFLTFSKGYPISESEVREFFTGNFGDIIEAIYMQEVSSSEQVLYARLVVHSASIVEMIVDGNLSKTKYSINGKHVWARKYVKKHQKSPPRVTTSPAPPPPPAAAPQP